jgi:hypothetical protein
MTTFSSLGIDVKKATITETVTIMGASSSKRFVELTLALPAAPRVQATFTREGIVTTLKKLFSKELQSGDKAFDDVVYISTDTPAETAALLANASVRATIRRAVVEGGSIQIVKDVVTVKMQGITDDEPDVVDLVRAVKG